MHSRIKLQIKACMHFSVSPLFHECHSTRTTDVAGAQYDRTSLAAFLVYVVKDFYHCTMTASSTARFLRLMNPSASPIAQAVVPRQAVDAALTAGRRQGVRTSLPSINYWVDLARNQSIDANTPLILRRPSRVLGE